MQKTYQNVQIDADCPNQRRQHTATCAVERCWKTSLNSKRSQQVDFFRSELLCWSLCCPRSHTSHEVLLWGTRCNWSQPLGLWWSTPVLQGFPSRLRAEQEWHALLLAVPNYSCAFSFFLSLYIWETILSFLVFWACLIFQKLRLTIQENAANLKHYIIPTNSGIESKYIAGHVLLGKWQTVAGEALQRP